MTPTENLTLIHRILSVLWNNEGAVFLKAEEDGSVRAYATLSDVFAWATADAEEVTLENIEIFEQAVKDLEAVNEPLKTRENILNDTYNCDRSSDIAILFACRVRKQKPFKHNGRYPVHANTVALIDALPYPDNDRSGRPIVQAAP